MLLMMSSELVNGISVNGVTSIEVWILIFTHKRVMIIEGGII